MAFATVGSEPSPYEPALAAIFFGKVAAKLAAEGVPSPALEACCETLAHLPPVRPVPSLLDAATAASLRYWQAVTVGYALWLARVGAARLANARGRGRADLERLPNPHDTPVAGSGADSIGGAPFVLPYRGPSEYVRTEARTPFGELEKGYWPRRGIAVKLSRVVLRPVPPLQAAELRQAVELVGRGLEAAWTLAAGGRDEPDLWRAARATLNALWAWQDAEGLEDTAAANALSHAAGFLATLRGVAAGPAQTPVAYCLHVPDGSRSFRRIVAADHVLAAVEDAWLGLRSIFAEGRGLELFSATDVPSEGVAYGVYFDPGDERTPDRPGVMRRGPDGPRVVVRAHATIVAPERPPALEAISAMAERQREQGWAHASEWERAARRVVAGAVAETRTGSRSDEDAMSAFSALHARYVAELRKGQDARGAARAMEFAREHLALIAVPSSIAVGGADVVLDRTTPWTARTVDWVRSRVVPAPGRARGAVIAVIDVGYHDRRRVLARAVLELSAGGVQGLAAARDAVQDLGRDEAWAASAATQAATSFREYEAWHARAGEDFLEDAEREESILRAWLRALETAIDRDPLRAATAFRAVQSVLRRIGDLGRLRWFPAAALTDQSVPVEESEAVSRKYIYRSATTPGAVVGVLDSGEAEDAAGRPVLVLSRGSVRPDWIARWHAAIGRRGVFGAAAADLAAALSDAEANEPGFAGREWGLGFLRSMLEHGMFSSPDGRASLLDAVEGAAHLPGVRVVPMADAFAGLTSDDRRLLREGAPEDAPMPLHAAAAAEGSVLALERAGLLATEAGKERWIVRPRVVFSAGSPNDVSVRLEDLHLHLRRWIEKADLADGKRLALRRWCTSRLEADYLRACSASPHGDAAAQAVRDLLVRPRGVLEFLVVGGCRDDDVWRLVVQAADSVGLTAVVPPSASALRSAQALPGVVVALVPASGSEVPALRILAGMAGERTAADVVLDLLSAVTRFDAVDPGLKEASSLFDALRDLGRADADVPTILSFLVTKAYLLLCDARDAGGREGPEAIAVVEGVVRRASELLERQGLQVLAVDPGADARGYEGKFRPTAGSVHWRVRRVVRPCLLDRRSGRVVQVGVVETD